MGASVKEVVKHFMEMYPESPVNEPRMSSIKQMKREQKHRRDVIKSCVIIPNTAGDTRGVSLTKCVHRRKEKNTGMDQSLHMPWSWEDSSTIRLCKNTHLEMIILMFTWVFLHWQSSDPGYHGNPLFIYLFIHLFSFWHK